MSQATAAPTRNPRSTPASTDSSADPTDAPGTTPSSVVTLAAARRALAVLRIAISLVFLWPVLDKTFGLGYATPTERAWLNGGSPTQGYLSSISGPFADTFGALAGPVTDWLFMLGMGATGLALLLGVGTRVAAVSGTLLMALLWATTWPVAAGSTNPVVEDHVVTALVVIVVALTRAGSTWGLGGVAERVGVPAWMR
ncbi:DoxX family membrane protein [Oerskovia sp. Root918]|uniref:DoxX family membrane protein n=1 Tax=Oerskovia sp. Root918 TaxID=1736607 RepID=UPI000AD6DAC5|nr:DoxX family membrane protein [Oerskovia sp. Root918]